jgi:acetyl esterase/lipase
VTGTSEHRYGSAPAQVCDLHLPDGPPRAVAVLVHGGFWRARYDRSQEHKVAADLVGRGWAVWNLDYRGVGKGPSAGGGWPATFEDVATAVDLLADVGGQVARPLPLDRVAAVGHSAGGQLALWIAGRHRLPRGAPGAEPRVRPVAVVSQAGVVDLVAAARRGVGNGAVVEVLGGTPERVPVRYALTSPMELVPIGVPTLLVTGDADDAVPPALSVSWAAAARAAGDDVTLHVEPGEGHMGHVDPASRVWAVARAFLTNRVLDDRMRA